MAISAVALCACGREPEPTIPAQSIDAARASSILESYPSPLLKEVKPENFTHRIHWVESYRLPTSHVRIGDYVLRAVHIGSSDDFDRFEASGYKGGAPFTLEFDRATSARVIIYPEDTSRPAALVVHASAYSIGEHWGRVPASMGTSYAFVASDTPFGEIRFEADEFVSPPGGRMLNDFALGGFKGVILKAVISADGKVQNVDFGYLDWWPCSGSGSRQLSLKCVRA